MRSISSLNQVLFSYHIAHCRASRPRYALLLALVWLLAPPRVLAQQLDSSATSDAQTMQQLLQRVSELEAKVRKIDELEARVKQLEAEKQMSATPSAVPSPVQPLTPPLKDADKQTTSAVPGQGTSGKEAEPMEVPPVPESMDLSKTLMRIRGFGDISLIGGNQEASPSANQPAQTTSFSLGQLDLFITSDVSDKFHFLTELIFEGGPDNIYGVQRGLPNEFKVEPERYLIEYSYNDYLNISAGRWHTAIGYYNTAYHHSTWFQTATGRPFLFAFEDEGGILPTHTVGISATGLIPSGALGLHYVAEAGNGRASRLPLQEEPVQNEADDATHKAYNLALFARPEALRGLQTGFSVYRDVLSPLGSPRVDETIMAGHIVFVSPKFEWLNEALVIRHALIGTNRVYNTPGFYTQIARQVGSFRPYFRYQYVNASPTEPIFPEVGLQHGPSAGIRFDASEFVALKLQYDYTFQRQTPLTQPGYSTLALQIGFTF